ncbi:neuropeptide F receptor-like [Mya arenaria]|uniref:neuropeptide F receptor-like n=1 Tax=Mya arenaria TaxID=6604 RepID=UPI0022E17B9E|nr:neuropeptide F receptor-like [Mya arenaria]
MNSSTFGDVGDIKVIRIPRHLATWVTPRLYEFLEIWRRGCLQGNMNSSTFGDVGDIKGKGMNTWGNTSSNLTFPEPHIMTVVKNGSFTFSTIYDADMYGKYEDYSINMSNIDFDGYELLSMLAKETERKYDETAQTAIIIVFSMLILFGSVGNGLVCYVVFRNAHMRTPRNIFIINLAISDLTLCLFTQPLNLYRLLNNQWHLGEFMCKLSGMLQGTNVFVSTISITAIALDRFQVIVYPTKDSLKKIGGAASLITIWIISLLMSSPLIIFSLYNEHQIFPEVDFHMCYCVEDLTLRAEKGAYSVASMMVQYILPVITVSIAHARICNKLRYRMVNRRPRRSSGEFNCNPNPSNRPSDNRTARKRKTNVLLAMIAIVFVLSWMPLNISNILVEFQFQMFRDKGIINYVYLVCHILVLSSACSNPVLYGWLNDNFRKEFNKVLQCGCFRWVKNKWTSVRTTRKRSVPAVSFAIGEKVEATNNVLGPSRRPTNTSQMFMTTELDQTCHHSLLTV